MLLYIYIYIHIHTPFLKVTGSRAAAGPRQLPGHARLSAHLGRWHAWAQPGDLTLFDGLEELVGTPLAGNHNMTGMENGRFLMGYGWDFVWLYGSDTVPLLMIYYDLRCFFLGF